MSDLESKLRTDLKSAGSRLSGTGVDMAGVERRILERAERRRRRRRVAGGLVAGAFLALAVGAAAALSGARSTKTLDPPEDFTAFCAAARKLDPNGTDETGRSPDQQLADTWRRVDDLKRVAPTGLQSAFGTLLAGVNRSDQPTSEQRKAALNELDGALRTHCHTTIRILGGRIQPTESRSSGSGSVSSNGTGRSDSCLTSNPFRICLVRNDGVTRIEASGLQPDSVAQARLVTATGPEQAQAPPDGRVGADGTYRPTNIGFLTRSVGDRITVRITFTPAGGAERAEDLTL